MKTLIAASLALPLAAVPALADDASLRAWSTFYSKDMNMQTGRQNDLSAAKSSQSDRGPAAPSNQGTNQSPATGGQNPQPAGQQTLQAQQQQTRRPR